MVILIVPVLGMTNFEDKRLVKGIVVNLIVPVLGMTNFEANRLMKDIVENAITFLYQK